MKRVLSEAVAHSTRSKRPRLVSGLVSDRRPQEKPWVAATHIRNWFRDPIVDFLEHQKRRGTRANPAYTHAEGFVQFLQKKGIEFESELIKYINSHRLDVVTAATTYNEAGCARTIELMREGVPAIHNAPLRCSDNTGGIADLLVRSDFLDVLVDEQTLTEKEKTIRAPALGQDYHYVVVDIKFSTLPLRADGRLLLNSDNYPAYKAQTWIYTKAVGEIQGYTSRYAFILGRRWRYSAKQITYKNYTCLSRLGTIDFKGVDKHVAQDAKAAIKWVRDVITHSHEWSVEPPSRRELYPNMCVDAGKWNQEKRRLADKHGEITSIWYCGVKHRDTALDQGITSWRDPNCNTAALNIRGVRAATIDAIMAINRQDVDKLRPDVIKYEGFDWTDMKNNIYVDFETLPDICADFSDLPYQNSTSMIFMIGVGRVDDGQWTYRQFLANKPTKEEEFRIMDEFMTYVARLEHPNVYFWHAEDRLWRSAEERQFDSACENWDTERKDRISDDWVVGDWCDLAKLFREEPIVIKGCYKYGLKDIAVAMADHGMITTKINSNCDSGMTAAIQAWECYKRQDDVTSCSVMRDITSYNEFDTKVLWDIHNYLVSNHS